MIRRIAFSALALSLGTQAFAQTSATSSSASAAAPASGTSTAAAPAAPEQTRFIDRLGVSYTGIYEGTSILAPLETHQPSATDKVGGAPIDIRNLLGVSYRHSPSLTVSATAFVMLLADLEKGGVTSQVRDPYVTVTMPNVINTSVFSYTTGVRYFAPVSTPSVDAGSLGTLRSSHVLSLQVPNSRFSLSWSNFAQVRLLNTSATGASELLVYTAPNLMYQVSPSVSVNVLYEALASMDRNTRGFISGGTDLEPGVSWDITPRINLNPYLDIKTSGDMRLETTSINAALSVRLL